MSCQWPYQALHALCGMVSELCHEPRERNSKSHLLSQLQPCSKYINPLLPNKLALHLR